MNALGLGTGLEALERQVDENVKLAGEQIAGPEALAADQPGEGGDGEPRSGVAGFAVEARELLFGDVFEITGQLGRKTEAVARTLGVDRFEQLLKFGNRQRDALAQEQERLAFGRNGLVQ